MADIWSKQKRSEVMSLIRSRGNKATELRLIEIFREHGITGWRRNQKLLGKPDFTFRRERVVVFVDGCFWHGCPKCYKRPASNQEFWDNKIAANHKRDRLYLVSGLAMQYHLRIEEVIFRNILRNEHRN